MFMLSIADTLSGTGGNMPFQGYNPPGDGSDFTDIDDVPRVNLNPMPALLTIARLAARINTAAVGDLDFATRVGVVLGSGFVIPDTEQGVAADVDVPLVQPADASDLDTVKAQLVDLDDQAVGIRIFSAYSLAAPLAGWALIASGFTSSGNLGASAPNADFFQAFGSNDGVTVEAQKQILWPSNLPGTFKYLLGVSIHNNPAIDEPSISFRLRVDGVTAIETSTVQVTTNPGFALNEDDDVHVDGGELICFAGHHQGPFSVDARCRVLYAIGFLPD